MTGILLNPFAGGGTALWKWQRVESAVRKRIGRLFPIVLSDTTDPNREVKELLEKGVTNYVAAGGDGTVNLLLSCLIDNLGLDRLQDVKLGALGLGSSNDFHKPFRDEGMIDGIPCLFDFASAAPRDVCRVTFVDECGRTHDRFWIINASVGITAEANWYFNSSAPFLRLLKRHSTACAILYSAFYTIASYKNYQVSLSAAPDQPLRTRVTNIGFTKSPHFSGNFCYDTPFERDSGHFYVHLCETMSLARTLLTLWRLSRRRFSGYPFTRYWRARSCSLSADREFAVEIDGEVVQTRYATFSVLEQLPRVCRW